MFASAICRNSFIVSIINMYWPHQKVIIVYCNINGLFYFDLFMNVSESEELWNKTRIYKIQKKMYYTL